MVKLNWLVKKTKALFRILLDLRILEFFKETLPKAYLNHRTFSHPEPQNYLIGEVSILHLQDGRGFSWLY